MEDVIRTGADTILNYISSLSEKQEEEKKKKGKGKGREGKSEGGEVEEIDVVRHVLKGMRIAMKDAQDIQTLVQWYPRVGRFLTTLCDQSWICSDTECCQEIISLLLNIYSFPYIERSEGEDGGGGKGGGEETKAKLNEWVSRRILSLIRMNFSPWPLDPSLPSPTPSLPTPPSPSPSFPSFPSSFPSSLPHPSTPSSSLSPCFPLSFPFLSPSPSLSSFLSPSPSETLSLLSSLEEIGVSEEEVIEGCMKEYHSALSRFCEPTPSGLPRGMLLKKFGRESDLYNSLPSFQEKNNTQEKFLSNPHVFYQRSPTSLLTMITKLLTNYLSYPLLLPSSPSPPFSTDRQNEFSKEILIVSNTIRTDPSLFSVMLSLLFSEMFYSEMDLYFVCRFLTLLNDFLRKEGGGWEREREGGEKRGGAVPPSLLGFSSSTSSPSPSPPSLPSPTLPPSILSLHFLPPTHPSLSQILATPPSPLFYPILNSLRLSLPPSSLPSLLLLHASHSPWSYIQGVTQGFVSLNNVAKSAVFEHIVWFWFPFVAEGIRKQCVEWMTCLSDILYPLFSRSGVRGVEVDIYNGESHVYCVEKGVGGGEGGEKGGKGEGGEDLEYLGDVFDCFKWDAIDGFRKFLKSKKWKRVGGVEGKKEEKGEKGEGGEMGEGRLRVLMLLGLLYVTPVPHIWCSEVIKVCLEVVKEEGRKGRGEGEEGEGRGDSEIVLFGMVFDFFDLLALKLEKEGKKRQEKHHNNTPLPLHSSVFHCPSSSSSSLPPPHHLFTNAYQHCLKQWEGLKHDTKDSVKHRSNHFFRHLNYIYSNYGEEEREGEEEGGGVKGGRKRKAGGGDGGGLPLKKVKKARPSLSLERKKK